MRNGGWGMRNEVVRDLMPRPSYPIPYTDSDEGDVAMSTTVSFELTDEQIARLEREAQRLGKLPSDVAARLVEESLREIEYPYIEFRNAAGGREAFLRGSRLQVWHLRWHTNFNDDDIPRIAAEFNIMPEAVADAFAYGRRYADEIEASLAENRHIADNIEQYFPGVRIVEIDATDS
jgi:hypothetical protein